MNEQGKVVRNKERLVSKVYSQKQGIDYEDTFSPIARIELVRMLLAYTTSKNLKVYQMDVKSAFLNGEIQEEVYIEKSEVFLLTKEKGYGVQTKESIVRIEVGT